MRKKLISMCLFIVAALSALLLCACGSDDDEKKSESAATSDKYIFHVTNKDGKGVAGVMLQICSGDLCSTATTDENGVAVYDGKPGKYEVHVLKFPSEYSYDKNKIYTTAEKPEEVTFVLENAQKSETSAAVDAVVGSEADEQEGKRVSILERKDEEKENKDSTNDKFPYYSKIVDIKPSEDQVKFAAVDRNGKKVTEDIFRDYDVTLINLWEPWCGGCVEEMPAFEAVYELAQDNGVKFNIIGFYDTDEGAEEVLKESGITYTIIKGQDLMSDYFTPYIPVNFFVNSEGYVLPVTVEECTQVLLRDFETDLGDYWSGRYNESSEEYYKSLEVIAKNGKLEETAAEEAASMVYDKGQTNNLSAIGLLQMIADRL